MSCDLEVEIAVDSELFATRDNKHYYADIFKKTCEQVD